MPLISVIIPVYNGEKTIQETIESVLQQTFTDWELIIIDDGSQDSTLEILESIRDDRIKVFSYPNTGLAASRNRGISHAIGKFLSFLDADDLWTPDKLEKQLATLQANSNAAVAYSWTDYIDEESKFLYAGSHITANGNVYEKLLINNFLENGSNPLIRRKALREVGEFDTSINRVADWDLYLRLAARYDFVTVPFPQVLYRVSSNSLSSNIASMEEQCLQVIEKNFRQVPTSLQYLKKHSLAYLYEYLTMRSLEGRQTREKSLVAGRCLVYTIGYNPSILKRRSRLMSVVLLKILVGVLLPTKQAQWLLGLLKRN
ncbi:glycosyltransferase [Oscillatoria salina]|uniref:glycosyltransferase n=1 Tax=Oscillatoria salina TaxID=331517 RepID=UPI0013BA334D|nr:glycosyltransferase [Oscillatoria salina]MBZ8182201.1 glycosyltransferase [Oscillatoria salina IIICB1]NET89066.1 glycosyltransferase [Kamptonema sp. SIO1D9]